MRVKLQLVMCHDDGHEETSPMSSPSTRTTTHRTSPLTLAESKHLLSTLQRHLLHQQVDTFLDTHATCPACGAPLKLKARGSRSLRTLFGTFMFIV